ncbi:MAG: hypothetical protein ABF780_05690 [Bifidobacterium aquikefiri]|uniref:DUF7426 domain-containing protein n=1 Tax=Bifidobacterium aquikefiri TaxID=1653207 RepID=A0A261G3G4_9BIFI|nr:hypothetical protein [Bifidobacterium aquikefiri]OZG65546.1 hypothetical protein BAQU_1729 [Bifidobacterium aquikefiri]
MAFTDFQDIAPEPLTLPINGKTYTVQPVSAADGLKAWKWIRESKKQDGSVATVEDVSTLLLGDTNKQLIKDHVSFQALNRVYQTVLADFTNGRKVAETIWETGGNPKAIAQIQSVRPDEADTTPTPDSTNGTKISPKKPTQE